MVVGGLSNGIATDILSLSPFFIILLLLSLLKILDSFTLLFSTVGVVVLTRDLLDCLTTSSSRFHSTSCRTS
jgi:hypothetical protein